MFTGESTEQMLKNPFIDSFILNIIVRKTVHIVAFGTLAILFLLSFWGMNYRYLIGWFLATCYGAIDEWHQTFVPKRDGIFTDVMIDSFGAIVALLCFYFIYNSYKHKKKKTRGELFCIPLKK